MPSASGPEAAEILRLDRPELRVLYATGWAGDKLLQYGLAESADVLHKPFTPDELLARVEQALAFRA
jgi:CheY-like chemotaxis protein